MIKPAVNTALVVFFVTMIPVLLALKILDRNRLIITGVGYTKANGAYGKAVAEGLLRRLDNPSFWNVVAVAVAGGYIVRAIGRLGSTVKWGPSRHLLAWGAWATLLVTAHVVAVHHNKETFFAYQNKGMDETVVLIQFIEGVIFVTVIVVGLSFLATALTCLDYLAKRFELAKDGEELDDVKFSASDLATAGLAPAIGSAIAVFFWKSLSVVVTAEPKPWGTSDVLWVVVLDLAMWMPFFYLFWQVRKRLSKWISFSASFRDVNPLVVLALSPFFGPFPMLQVKAELKRRDSGATDDMSDDPPGSHHPRRSHRRKKRRSH